MVRSRVASLNFTANSESLPDDTAGAVTSVIIFALPDAIDGASTIALMTWLKVVAGPAAGCAMLPVPTSTVEALMADSHASANLDIPASALGVKVNASSLDSNTALAKVNLYPEGVSAAGLVVIPVIRSAYQLAKVLAQELSSVFGSESKVVCHFDKGSMATTRPRL